jgi:hypothetical protein
MFNEQSRMRIWEARFNLHLMKPVDPAKLIQVVDSLFRHQSSCAVVHSQPAADRWKTLADNKTKKAGQNPA